MAENEAGQGDAGLGLEDDDRLPWLKRLTAMKKMARSRPSACW